MAQPHIDASGERARGVLYAPVSWGELVDKIAILELKAARIRDQGKLENVQRELAALRAVRDREGPLSEAAARASSRNRARKSGSWPNSGRSSFTATSRSSWASRAR